VPSGVTESNLDKYPMQISEGIFSAGFMHLLGILHSGDVAVVQRSREYHYSTVYKAINSSKSNLSYFFF
jgi:hypothetical protein